MTKAKRIVILGAGFGGLVSAILLAKRNRQVEIVLIDKNGEHLYTPWLYDVAVSFLVEPKIKEIKALKKVAAISVKSLIEMHGFKNLRFRQAEVKNVDVDTKHVVLENGMTLAYDFLVVALGAKTTYYGIPGMEQFALPLKTLEDGMRVQSKVGELVTEVLKKGSGQKNIVIVGAGPTGTETASELVNFFKASDAYGAEISQLIRVSLVDSAPKVLNFLDPYISQVATGRLNKLGVDLRINTAVLKVEKNKLFTSSGEIPYDVLVWAGGIEPSEVSRSIKLKKDQRGRIISRQTTQAEEFDDIFVVGDCSAFYPVGSDRALPQTGWAAIDAAKVSVNNILAIIEGKDLLSYYPPKKHPAAVTVGGRFGTGVASHFKFSGYLGFILRRLIDLHYFLTIMPFLKAVKFWSKGTLILMKND